jgi:hypothetical protein
MLGAFYFSPVRLSWQGGVSLCCGDFFESFEVGKNACEMEEPHALHLSRFTERDRANAAGGGQLVELSPRQSAVVFRPRLRRANPDRQESVAFFYQFKNGWGEGPFAAFR